MSGFAKIFFSIGLIGITTLIDQVTKYLARSWILLGESKNIIPNFFDLTHLHNPGAAFGIMSGMNPSLRYGLFLLIYAFVGLFAVAKIRVTTSRLEVVSLSLLVGGATGNAWDRFRDGYVTDFLDFYFSSYHYPAFNLADVAICTSVAILLIKEFVDTRHRTQ